ncbi:hypothetical protein SAMN02745911_1262 [Aureimonas altamirensis DSM 21988]|uniref:DUF1468 domain-containing protein n=1 Tax=Aureimonas altamirensis DSM 21988 TaxID=1121026 RepID=A0ABY1IBU4_9HYPH|nr:tripartite tricarboxylate transporter TctB family protein [Aureimonas altamirensis]SHI96696.1 hypothetical protein SAMN02745911_1262 [Aureimonas altamirensis DSM 21988]
MLKPIASFALLATLALVVGGAINDTPSLLSYPVVVSSIAFLLAASTVLPAFAKGGLTRTAPAVRVADVTPAGGRKQMVRIVALCAIWIAYALVLTSAGFVAASSAALVASLLISMGSFSWRAAVAAVVFVLALAVLVTTVLFVPVPKAAVDYWIDEAVYTLTEG